MVDRRLHLAATRSARRGKTRTLRVSLNSTKSRLLLYLVLLPGFAIPSALMLWFPNVYTTAFAFLQANPLAMLAIAIVACTLFWYQAATGIPERFKRSFLLSVFVTAAAAIAYISLNFNSLAIAEAMVAGGLLVPILVMLIKDYSARKRDT